MDNITEKLSTPVWGKYNVIVVGGGIGGICAAVSATRSGAEKVLLLEKSVQFGGLATFGLISWFEPLCDGEGQKLMYGMADELMQLSMRYGPDCLPEKWRDNPDQISSRVRFATHFSPALFVLAIDQLIKESGVDVLLDTLAVKPVMDGSVCKGVVVENKSGRGFYGARVIVDATGDSEILARAGVPCELGENYLSYVAYQTDFKGLEKAERKDNILYVRKWLKIGSDLWGNGHPEDKPMLNGVTAEEVTQFVLDGRSMLFDRIKNDKRTARDLTVLPGMAQFRKTRRIVGEYTLTEEDEGRHFSDSIAVAGDFQKRGKRYEIPYRLLYNAKFENLLTVGRSVSSSGWAWDVTRVIPVAAATGQAAGTAASICSAQNIAVPGVGIEELQQRLMEAGVHIKLK
jgi:hypothetical protein